MPPRGPRPARRAPKLSRRGRCKFFGGIGNAFLARPLSGTSGRPIRNAPSPFDSPPRVSALFSKAPVQRGFLLFSPAKNDTKSGHFSQAGTFGPPDRINHIQAGWRLKLGGKAGIGKVPLHQ